MLAKRTDELPSNYDVPIFTEMSEEDTAIWASFNRLTKPVAYCLMCGGRLTEYSENAKENITIQLRLYGYDANGCMECNVSYIRSEKANGY